MLIPQIRVQKYSLPSIYVDTCVMIELSKFKNGVCKNEHKKEIGELYSVLSQKMQERRIICPCGNQLQEMGMTKGREKARQFLYGFTNAQLRHPDVILNNQMQIGYHCFSKNESIIDITVDSVYLTGMYQNVPLLCYPVAEVCSEKAEELRQIKLRMVDLLNEAKAQKRIKTDYTEQLNDELGSEKQLFLNGLSNPVESEEALMRYFDELQRFYYVTGFAPTSDTKLHLERLLSYYTFLQSIYHDWLPYIWIRSNLWTHLMQRPNKIRQGDNLDIKWAAAYLPFADYAVTDSAFCELLNNSGLAKHYGAQIYSFKSLDDLLEQLNNLQ